MYITNQMNRDRESMSLEARVTIGLIAFSTVLYGCSEANNHKDYLL